MDNFGDNTDGEPAIEVRNCTKNYKPLLRWRKSHSEMPPVLNNLNLTVPRKSIYALLGPSGCGKTTLMKCILGRLRVNGGSVGIFGRQLGSGYQTRAADLGYMPQETSIFALLTIAETLRYFGQLHGLSNALIKFQTKMLVEFLRLPSEDTINKTLSGGQLRRLSFAVAIIHNPKLLVMDEPTVGVDPICSHRMRCYWRFMINRYSTTIILSTHYIEEARTVDFVGLMQDGTMLVEGAPNHLLNVWKVSTLEELFFNVYSAQLDKKLSCDSQNANVSKATTVTETTACSFHHITDDCHSLALSQKINETLLSISLPNESGLIKTRFPKLLRLETTVRKNCISLYRYPITLLCMLCIPAVSVCVVLISNPGQKLNLELCVLNEDTGHLGDTFLSMINSDVIKKIPLFSFQDGHRATVDGECFAFVYIRENFTDTFIQRLVGLDALHKGSSKQKLLSITIDKTDIIIAQIVISELMAAAENLNREALFEAGYSSNRSNQYIQVGTSVLILFLEKKDKCLERSLLSGSTIFEIVIGFVIVDFFVNIAQAAGIIVSTFYVFKVPTIGSVGLVSVIVILSGLVGMSLGMFFAATCDQLLVIASCGCTLIMCFPALSGAFWPTEASTYIFQIVSLCLPFNLPNVAMIDIMYRDFGIFHTAVISGIAVMLAWIFLLVTLTVICMSVTSRLLF